MHKTIVILLILFFANMNLLLYAQLTNVKKIRINPELATGGKVAQFIDSVNFIPLENSKESHINFIYQLEASDNYFFILNKETDAILIFTKKGHFHAKIKIDKSVYHFSLNKKMKGVEIDNYSETLTYNFEGKLIKKTVTGNRPNTLMGLIKISLDDNYTVYYNTNTLAKDSLIYQLLVYRDDKITSYFLPYRKSYKLEPYDNLGPMNFSTNFNESDTGIYYITNFDYNVYRLTPSSLVPVYQFIFPIQNSLPKDFSDTYYNEKRMAFFQKDENQAVIPRLYRFYKKADQLFFSEGKCSYILNIKTQQFVSVNKIISDASSYFLPITESEADSTKNAVYINFDGSYFYFSCSNDVINNQHASNKNKKIIYPPELEKYFSGKKKSTGGNLILVQVKFKNNFN